jgi:hypothetical protein
VAELVGVGLENFLGSGLPDFQGMILHPSLAERKARRDRIMAEGGSASHYVWVRPPELQDDMLALVTTTRLDHPDGQKYLLQTGHDVSKIEEQLDYLRAPALQNLIALIIERTGHVLAATDAAAKFCLPGAKQGKDIINLALKDTPYPELAQHEAAEVQRSAQTEAPAITVDWLLSADPNTYGPYTVARIAFADGRWLIVMLPLPTDVPPYVQLSKDKKDMKTMLGAKNLRGKDGRKLTRGQFCAMVDIVQGLSLEEASAKWGVAPGSVSSQRKKLAKTLGLDDARDIKGAVVGTTLGYCAQVYADIVDDQAE